MSYGSSTPNTVCDSRTGRHDCGARGHDRPGCWLATDDALLDRLLLGEGSALSDALADSEAAGLPPIEVSAQSARLLYLMTKIIGARRVLEVGTLGGYSTGPATGGILAHREGAALSGRRWAARWVAALARSAATTAPVPAIRIVIDHHVSASVPAST